MEYRMSRKSILTVLALLVTVSVVDLCSCDGKPPAQQKTTSSPVPTSPPRPGRLANLREKHPRLLFTMADQRHIEKLAKKNAFLSEMIAELNYNSEQMLNQPTVQFKVDKCKNILPQARVCLSRVATLSMSYRLTGDTRFFERARKEMLAAAAMKSWNPKHFLDVAEISCALAIGYDWLYNTLSEADRATIRSAIVTKGLKPGTDCYSGRWKFGPYNWTTSRYNWNQVCNGGMILAALAVAEDEPALADEVISYALRSIPTALASYRPDGAGHEGPGYWVYGTTFTGLTIAALDSALGNDFGLSKSKCLNKTGDYRLHTMRPNGTLFNYADCGNIPSLSPVMFWLARKYDRPAYAWFERRQIKRVFAFRKQKKKGNGKYNIRSHYMCRLFAMEIAWFNEKGDLSAADNWPLDVFFGGLLDIVTMRSAWGDEGALYAGLKGANPRAGHRHLDAGIFVLDSDGVSWTVDLGGDSYSLPGYGDFGGRRWKFYRVSSKSHNTLVIGGKNQHPWKNIGKVIKFFSTPDRTHAVMDMSKAYGGQAGKVLRGLAMLDRSRVLIQDEITAPTGEVRWGMLTRANIKLDGKKATLTQDGKTLLVEILSPANARFKIVTPPTPRKGERAHPENLSMLAAFVKPAGKKPVRLAILLTPVGEKWKKFPAPKLKALSEWKTRAASAD